MSRTWRRENRKQRHRARDKRHNSSRLYACLDSVGMTAKVFENELAAMRQLEESHER